MNERYLSQCGDTDQVEILFPVGTKNREKGLIKADEMLNDILSAIAFTVKNYDKFSKAKNPNFIKALKQIDKKLWKCLR